ncbi:MAG TPA: S9 family peptidase [Pirellulales bacterium]|nr:S9 family peptidase [Pirellulales bacterium]
MRLSQNNLLRWVFVLALALCPACNPAVAEKGKKGVDNKAATEEISPPAEPMPVEAKAEPAATAKSAETPSVETAAPTKIENPGPAKVDDQPAAAAKAPAPPKYLAGVPLIPRTALFGNPDKSSPRISPDGKRLAYLAPVEGVMNVWVGPVDDPSAAKPVTEDKKRGIRAYFWAYTNDHVLYVQDQDGDENWHVYAVNLADNKTKDLTPLANVAAQIEEVSERAPDEILIGLNDRDQQFHDIYRVNIVTGERQLVEQNKQGFAGYLTDDDLKVRFAMQYMPDGSNVILKPNGSGGWDDYMKIPMADTLTTQPAGFNKSGDVLYFIDSRDRNTGALTTIDLGTGKQSTLAEHGKADVAGVIAHPTEKTVQAVAFTYTRKEWQILDPAIKPDLDYLATVTRGDVEITSRSLDDRLWTVAYLTDDGPVSYYLYDHEQKKATFLFNNRNDLDGLPLVKMHDVVVKARDGLELVCYLSLPKGTDPDGDGRPDQPVPMVLDVHGGPWARDDWGYDATHQLWANRGYAVLSINFRGSTGFGKEFVNAGNKEWAGKMHTDLLDAVDWAVTNKIAASKLVAITGGSYGGYATLVGMTLTPDVFACGIDLVGPSNIITLLQSIPPYWQPQIQLFKDRVGDFTTDAGKAMLTDRSPLSHVANIKRPLLIGQGANDPRVKQAEADQVVSAMEAKKIPVTYVLYPDEGHGFARPENRMSFYAVSEAFLAVHLGGRYEPIGTAFAGSSITVPVGADEVPGLAQALPQK